MIDLIATVNPVLVLGGAVLASLAVRAAFLALFCRRTSAGSRY